MRPHRLSRLGRALVAAALLLGSCGGNTPSQATDTTRATATSVVEATTTVPSTRAAGLPLRGFSLSPRSFEADDFLEFFELASEHGDAIGRVGDAAEWGDPESALVVVHHLSAEYGYLPIGVAGVFSTDTGRLLRPLDDDTMYEYTASARAYAEEWRPAFLGLGVEVDTLYRASPADFERFVELFSRVAREVRSVSPGTRLLVVFQLERTSGLHGGLFGGVDDPSSADWALLERFPEADVIGFSTYPGLVFSSPDDIPGDYYRGLAIRTGGRPVAFTEMGWHAEGDYGAYSGSAAHQARFVERFPELIGGLDVAFYLWAFLYDQPAPAPFSSMGLLRADGSPRPAWEAWMAGE